MRQYIHFLSIATKKHFVKILDQQHKIAKIEADSLLWHIRKIQET